MKLVDPRYEQLRITVPWTRIRSLRCGFLIGDSRIHSRTWVNRSWLAAGLRLVLRRNR